MAARNNGGDVFPPFATMCWRTDPAPVYELHYVFLDAKNDVENTSRFSPDRDFCGVSSKFGYLTE